LRACDLCEGDMHKVRCWRRQLPDPRHGQSARACPKAEMRSCRVAAAGWREPRPSAGALQPHHAASAPPTVITRLEEASRQRRNKACWCNAQAARAGAGRGARGADGGLAGLARVHAGRGARGVGAPGAQPPALSARRSGQRTAAGLAMQTGAERALPWRCMRAPASAQASATP